MNTAALREQITRAQEHETRTGQLLRQLEMQLPHLHPAIHLPDVDARGVLARFVVAYIEQVPDLLDAAHEVALQAGIESQIKPVLKIAEQFFSARQPSWPVTKAWTACWTKPIWRIVWWKRSTTCTSCTSDNL